MTKRITATRLARNLSAYVGRAKKGETFVVELRGEPVCQLAPVEKKMTMRDFAEALRTAPRADPGFARDVRWAIKHQGKMPLKSPWER